MVQETIIEGIFRSLKNKKSTALVIIFLGVLGTLILSRMFPPIYESYVLLRVLSTENIPGESLAASMQGILARLPEVVSMSQEINMRTLWGTKSEFYRLTDVGPQLVRLELRHYDPKELKKIGDKMVNFLSEQFLEYTFEADHFEIESLEMKKKAILEKMISIRQEADTEKADNTFWGNTDNSDSNFSNEEIKKIQNELDELRKKIATVPKVCVVSSQEETEEYKNAKRELARARATLAELLINYREKHPKVIKANAEIARLEKQVRSFSAKKDRKQENPEYYALLKEISEKEVKLADLIRSQETKKNNTNSSEPITILASSNHSQRLQALKQMYDATVMRLEQIEVKKATARGKIQVLRKNHELPNRIGLSLVQRGLLGLFSSTLFAIILLYSPIRTDSTTEKLVLSNASLLGFGAGFDIDPTSGQPIMRIPLLSHNKLSLPAPCTNEPVHDERLIVLNEPNSRILTPLRSLLANLQIQLAETGARVLMVISSRSGMGRTTLVANLGILFAQEGYSIVLVDANFRKPALHRVFEIDNFRGLSNLLQEQKIDGIIQETWIKNLSVIPSGPIPDNSLELISSVKMKQVLDSLKRRFEIVLIDTPGFLDYPDARIIASQVSGVISLNRDSEVPEDGRACREFLRNLKSQVLGFVQI